MSVTFEDINKNLPGGCNPGGIAQKIYFAPWDDVHSWPTEPVLTGALTLEQLASLTGNIVMKEGKRFWELYLTDETGEWVPEFVGNKDCISYVQHLKFFHPGLQKKILGFMNATKNENLVFIVVDNTGQMYLMGNDRNPATFASSPDGAGTGKATTDNRGVSMEFTFKCCNIYVYTGVVPLTPAAAPLS